MGLAYHFDDCPYFCNDKGMVLDTVIGKMVPCPHCSEKRKELLRSGMAVEENTNDFATLSSLIGVNSKYLSSKFVYDSIIPEGERVFIDSASVDMQKEEAEKLYNDLLCGELPKSSMCFGFGIKCRYERFVYPLLAAAYKSGFSIGKFMSIYSFSRLLLSQSDELDDLYKCDFLIMMLNEGSTQADMSNATGLMITRAIAGKPTIFITNWSIEACSGLLWYSRGVTYKSDADIKKLEMNEEEWVKEGDEDILNLAKPVFVKYISGKNATKPNRYVASLYGLDSEDTSYGDSSVGINGHRGMRNGFMSDMGDFAPVGGVSISDL